MRYTGPYLKLQATFFAFFLLNVMTGQLPGVYALTDVTIIDAANQKPLANQTVIVKGQTIDDVFPTGTKRLADTIIIFSLKGKYILPGLIDTHVHLATDPSGSDNPSNTKQVLEKMLYSGITAVRDMAGDARTLASLSRDAHVGDIVSPDIYYSALMAGPEFFKADQRTVTSTRGGVSGNMPFMKAITDSTDMVIAVAEAKGSGATGIKLYSSLTGSIVQKIVAEAKKQNMQVWAHATLFPAKPLDLVQAGVNVISHADLLIFNLIASMDSIPRAWRSNQTNEFLNRQVDSLNLDGLFELIKKKNTILNATVSAVYRLIKTRPLAQMRYEFAKRITARAYKAGVKICTGTDSDQELFVQDEMKLLVHECGFTPFDAIVAATKNSAEAIGILDTHGTIDRGKAADLLVLDKNPLDDINNIGSVNFVTKAGKMYKK